MRHVKLIWRESACRVNPSVAVSGDSATLTVVPSGVLANYYDPDEGALTAVVRQLH